MIISCLLQTDVQCLVTKTKCKHHSQVCIEKTEIKKANMERQSMRCKWFNLSRPYCWKTN